jgi:acetoin utilization deacetylase AcuC-like enzyme
MVGAGGTGVSVAAVLTYERVMSVAYYTHPDMLAHTPPRGHHETPARLVAVTDALADATGLDLEPLEAPLVEDADLALVHSERYVAALRQAEPARGVLPLDAERDTWLSPGSMRAAARAAGAVAAAVRRVASGQAERAFCAVRPPGHHAGPENAMGFCLYSNVAIGARVAQAEGLARVAVVDFDVHHGNGTQELFESDPNLFFASIHQWPGWPGSGGPTEAVPANIANAGVRPFAPRDVWRRTFETLIERVDAFAPDLILVSAGFDAHAGEPVSDADQQLEAEDFAWATRAIVAAAKSRARGRVVSSLEGGYDLAALGQSAVAHVRALRGA